MPIVCKYHPNRSHARQFTARDAGRIICLARQAGASEEEIWFQAKRCLPSMTGECEDAKVALDAVLSFILSAAATMLLPEVAFLQAIASIGKIAGRIPGAGGLVSKLTAEIARLSAVRTGLLDLGRMIERISK